jgi:non-specific serine/threonine protein kinase
VDQLLNSCSNLKILATSREALGLTSEYVWSVPVLSLPNPQPALLIDSLMQYEAIHLFVERASAGQSDFALTERNASSVVQVCQRLDGIPLAIELAAARVRMMSVGEIAKRLEDRFNFLTAGNRTALPRHQTLRAAIDWSYELLSQPERLFFSRISVFAGGFTLHAAEKIAAGGGVSTKQVIHLLGQMINKSLVTLNLHSEEPGSETRYGMLETIREYAHEKLDELGEMEQMRQRHRDFFIGFAEQAALKLRGAGQFEWLNRLEAEHNNLRAVLQWTYEVGDRDTTLRLAEVLFWFWNRRGYLSEGRVWLERALADDPALTRSAQATLLYQVAVLAGAQGDFARARELVEKSIVLWRTLDSKDQQGLPLALALLANWVRDGGDLGTSRSLAQESVALSREQGNSWNLAFSLMFLGMALRDQEDFNLAQSAIEESVRIWQELGDLWGLPEALRRLGLVAYRRGDYEVAYSLAEKALHIQRQLGDKQRIAYSIHNLGIFTLAQGKMERAKLFFDQGLILFREIGDKNGIVLSLQYQGLFALLQGDDVQAQSFLEEGLTLARETGPLWIRGNYLLWLADLAADREQFRRAVRLCSAAKTHLDAVASFWDAFERARYERIINLTRASLGENAFSIAQAEGRAMTIERAVAYALEDSNV